NILACLRRIGTQITVVQPESFGDLRAHHRLYHCAVPYELQLVYPALATLSGQPATAFPVGLTRTGLPIGLQVIGPYLEDRTPIRFAALVGQECGGYHSPPGYAEA